MSPPQPQTRFDALKEVANEAINSRDWASLHFNAQLMRDEDPSSPTVWSYLGIALINQGFEQRSDSLIQQGLECHAAAVRHGKDDSVAWANFGLALVLVGQYENALGVLDRAAELNPGDSSIWKVKGHAQIALNQLDEAEESVCRAFNLLKVSEVLVFMINRLFLGNETLLLEKALVIGVRRDVAGFDVEFVCEENEFDIYGTGNSFRDALIDVCEYFYTLVEEYVDTDDPLDEGGQALAVKLREYIRPETRIRQAEYAG